MLCSRAAVLMLGVLFLAGLSANALEVASAADLSAAASAAANAWDDVSAQPIPRSASIRGDRGLGSKSNAVSPNSTSTAKSSKSRKSKSKSSSGSGSTPVDPIDPIVEPPIDPIAPIGRESCTCGDDGYTVEVGRNSKSNAIDLSALTYSILDKPSNIDFASLDSSQGVYTYTPRRGYRGEDVFVYQIVDANTGFTKSATVTVVVGNRAPVALSAEYETGAGETIEFTLQATDADVTNNIQEESALTYTITSTPEGPFIRNAGANTYTFLTETAGTYKIGFTVSDGLASDEGTITITVTAAPPEAFDATYITNEEESIEITLGARSGSNEPVTSPEGDCGSFTYVVDASSTENGEVSETDESCIYTYTPNPGFSGQDSFTYRAFEGGVESNVATITINVNAIPVASDVSATTDQNTSVDISVSASDTDLESLQFSVQKKPLNGVVTDSNACDSGPITGVPGDNGTTSPGIPVDITGTVREGMVPGNRALQSTGIGGTFTACYRYTPSEGYTGTDTFTYVASDGTANSNEATVTVSVVGPPIAEEGTYNTNENSQIEIELIATGGSDNGDPSCGGLTYDVVSGPENGILSANGMYNFDMGGCMKTYTPSRDFFGQDSFTFKASDDNGNESNVATVTINVNAIPLAVDVFDEVYIGDSVTFVVEGSDEDDGETLTFSIGASIGLVQETSCDSAPPPVFGGNDNNNMPITGILRDGESTPGNRALATTKTACYTYTPEGVSNYTDVFTYTVSDGMAVSDPATIRIDVELQVWAQVRSCSDDRFCCKEFVDSIRIKGDGSRRRRLDIPETYPTEFTDSCAVRETDNDDGHRNLFSPEDIDRLVLSKPGEVNLDLNFVEKKDMLTIEQCNDLIEYLDKHAPIPRNTLYHDKILDIPAEDLTTIIGLETMHSLLDFLYDAVGEVAPVREISLRRTINNGSHGHFIDFHTDEEVSGYLQSTVIVPIGDEENDVVGGDPWYLSHDGPVMTKRERGKAYAHSYDVLHAVGPIIGKRMSLLIHLDHSEEPSTYSLIRRTGLRLMRGVRKSLRNIFG